MYSVRCTQFCLVFERLGRFQCCIIYGSLRASLALVELFNFALYPRSSIQCS